MDLYEVPINSMKEEKVKYDSPLLPAYIHEAHLKDYRGYRAEAHFHSDLEFIKVLQGTLSYSVNGKVLQINEGEGLFVNAKALHFGFSKKKRDCLFQVVVFSPLLLNVSLELGKDLVVPILDRGVDHFLLLPDVPYQREVLKGIQDIFDSKFSLRASCELQIVSLFYKIVYLLFPHIPLEDKKANAHYLPIMQKMLVFVEANYSTDISLKDIAASGNVSLRSVNRFFSSFLHASPKAYLINFRLHRAAEMLANSDERVQDIAFKCGYSSPSFFVNSFRDEFGVTPLKYRKKPKDISLS